MSGFWAAFIAALGAVVVSLINTKKINEIHVLMNSRLDELLALTKKSATAEGFKAGQASPSGSKQTVQDLDK